MSFINYEIFTEMHRVGFHIMAECLSAVQGELLEAGQRKRSSSTIQPSQLQHRLAKMHSNSCSFVAAITVVVTRKLDGHKWEGDQFNNCKSLLPLISENRSLEWMELSSVSLEKAIDGMFYHRDAEDLVSKKKININSFLSIAQQLYSKFSPSHLMVCI